MNLFIPIAVVAVVAALALLVLRDPDALQRKVLAIFRRAEKPPKAPGASHYYKSYWS
jgi:hypothetical protein